MGVPTVYDSLFKPFLRDERLRSVRLFESGGGVTPEDLIRQFEATLGVPISPVWGSTETSGIALATPPDQRRPPGAVGLLCPGFEARIVDEAGDEVLDEPGQLVLRGKSIMKGYLSEEDEVSTVLQDEWYHTGDLFSRDTNGFFSFRGRVDEMFKHRGFKVYPCEIEQILLRHPAVAQAAVIGRYTERGEREPIAFVSCRPGQSVTAGELRSFCRTRLAPYQMPRNVMIKDVLPATGSGKIRKRELDTEDSG
jgi:long-chain acyl-CoA synthetase